MSLLPSRNTQPLPSQAGPTTVAPGSISLDEPMYTGPWMSTLSKSMLVFRPTHTPGRTSRPGMSICATSPRSTRWHTAQ